MKPQPHHFFRVIFFFLCEFYFAQTEKLSDYYLSRRPYENSLENDSTALPAVGRYISKAKNEFNWKELYQGYKDALFYSADPVTKLKYADSLIYTARLAKDDNLLSSAYLSKGIVYYYNFRNYRLALNEYLKAYEKNKKNDDPYSRSKINYHIGVVKSYLGLYKNALENLQDARASFEDETRKDIHPNRMFSNLKGYYNTLHQMAVCYRNLGNFKTADSLVDLGLISTVKNEEYSQEYSYFLKEKGIGKYCAKEHHNAINLLRQSLTGLSRNGDFAWLSVSYSYLGKAQWEDGQTDQAILYFSKVDSIFNKHSFIIPESRDIYRNLITYYINKHDIKTSLYYGNQLLKIQESFEKDLVDLPSKIHKDYDVQQLLQHKLKVQQEKALAALTIVGVIFVAFLVLIFLLYRYQTKIFCYSPGLSGIYFRRKGYPEMPSGSYRVRFYHKTEPSPEIVNNILSKLEKFEVDREFLVSGTTIVNLAQRFGVSESHLSEVVNEHKRANFFRYLNELRIGYITDKLYKEPKYLKLKSEILAKECGIASRTNFSSIFREINGITFKEFIKKRKQDLENVSG